MTELPLTPEEPAPDPSWIQFKPIRKSNDPDVKTRWSRLLRWKRGRS